MKEEKKPADPLLQQKKNSIEAIDKKNKLLTELFDYSVRLSCIPFTENFYLIAARELKRIFGALGVTITTYNAETSELILQYSTLSENEQKKAARLIGQNLEGMKFKVSKDLYTTMTSEWVKNVTTLNEVTFGAISPVIGKIVEKAFHLEWFSGMILQDQDTLIGTAVLIGRKGTDPPLLQDLKSFSGVTAVALGRWLNEQKALLTEMKYKSLAENMKDVLWQSDLQSRITYVSPSGFKILGYKPEELLNRNFSEIVTPESYATISDFVNMRTTLTGKNQKLESARYEVEVIHRSGNRFWAEIVSSPIYDYLGNMTGFQGVARDISERKADEIKIRQQYEKLELLNAEKDKLFSIIAHDLKGALHGFLGYSKYMADRIDKLSLDKLKDISNTIRTIGLNLNELLENLLEWSMMQRDYVNYMPKSHDFNAILEYSMRTMEQLARNKEITIVRTIPPKLTVFVDYQMITSIVRNLLSNAVKFTPRNGHVEIFTGEKADHFIEIIIRDNGIGMDDNTLDKLFRINNVVHTPGTEGETSSGLGLILCHEYIAKHKGRIWYESEIDKGTCVHFTIPADRYEN